MSDGIEVSLFGVALPILAGHVTDGRSFETEAVTGTGFVPTPGVIVTCRHCVTTDDADVKFAVGGPELESRQLLRIDRVTPDPRGLDLATAAIDFEPPHPFNLSPQEPYAGLDVWAAGFPLPEKEISPGMVHFQLQARLLRGYIVRSFENTRHSGFGPHPTYELDMLAPAGLSGGPLLVHGPGPVGLRLAGVVYGSHDSYTIEESALMDPETGTTTPEARRYVSFGLAHQLSSLADLSGEATDGRPLRELITSET